MADGQGHDIHYDRAGFGYDRLTCRSCRPFVLVKRGGLMTDDAFAALAISFLAKHPPQAGKVTDDTHGGRQIRLKTLQERLRLN